jgi:hypothetical protein
MLDLYHVSANKWPPTPETSKPQNYTTGNLKQEGIGVQQYSCTPEFSATNSLTANKTKL